MKIVITGGAGFIGSHLCDLYIEKDHEVICIDNLISGNKKNISHLLENKKFQFIEHDIIEPLEQDLDNVDAIFHFASPASPNPESPVSYMANPIQTLMVNSLGTKRMLDLARANNCQIILASTSEVYGDPQVHPQTEDYWGNVSPHGPRSCYDESKRFLEAIAFAYHREFNTKIKVLRIFNTYGPRMHLDEGRFIPSLVRSYIEGVPFIKFAAQDTTRSFCYIDDLITGIDSVFTTDKMIGEIVNLGSPDEHKITDVINLLEKITNTKLKIIEKPELEDDPKRRKPDITKANSLLGWSPKIKLEDGLVKMIKHYQQ